MLARTPEFPHARRTAEEIAVGALTWIAFDSRERDAFLQTTGLQAETIRSAAGTSQFLAGVLDYVVDDRATLREATRVLDVDEAAIHAARRELIPSASVTPVAFGPGPLHQRCQACGRTRRLDRRRDYPHVPMRVVTVQVPRCGPCGGGFAQAEEWLDEAGNDLIPY